jgi:D-3-phosphoglycerate dehydrogenase / 2-oxoglutarate reductase
MVQQHWVYRVDISPYQGEDFPQKEREMIDSLDGFHYLEQMPTKEIGPGVLITNTNTRFDQLIETPLFSGPKSPVSLIIHPNSGYDNIPASWASKSAPPILVGNPIRQTAVTEYTISAILSHFAPIDPRQTWDANRQWNRLLLKEQRLLVVGDGHIGREVARAMRPLVDELTIYDPFKGAPDLKLEGITIVALCASLNPTSERLINDQFLAALPPNYLLVNGARGGLIDEQALLNSLNENGNAHAFLDVFQSEPLAPDHPFFTMKNATISCHIAGVHQGLDQAILEFEGEVLTQFRAQNGEMTALGKIYPELLLKNRFRQGFLI